MFLTTICIEMIRHRKTPEQILEKFKAKKLSKDSFSDIEYVYSQGEDVFKSALEVCYKRAKNSVFKCAQGAPILILSPRSRGFSSRETIINYYNGGI